VKQAMEEVRASVGDDGLDGLINNAGVAMICPLELVPEEDFSQVFDINVTGACGALPPCGLYHSPPVQSCANLGSAPHPH
jgi:NAD(P)-dependent dehydrogenase (short-subunit alcohol dehydrogenase family)